MFFERAACRKRERNNRTAHILIESILHVQLYIYVKRNEEGRVVQSDFQIADAEAVHALLGCLDLDRNVFVDDKKPHDVEYRRCRYHREGEHHKKVPEEVVREYHNSELHQIRDDADRMHLGPQWCFSFFLLRALTEMIPFTFEDRKRSSRGATFYFSCHATNDLQGPGSLFQLKLITLNSEFYPY